VGSARTLISSTVALGEGPDPAAFVFSSRRASDRWFCWEEPDRGLAIAALGSAAEVNSRGERRFAEVAAGCAEAAARMHWEGPDDPPSAVGPVWTGGFAFAPEGGRAPTWSSFPPALMVLPELSLTRSEGQVWLTVTLAGGLGVEHERALARLGARLAELEAASPLPMLEPDRIGRTEIRSVRPPREFEAMVEAAVQRIRAGEVSKTVLAREVVLAAQRAHDPAAVFGAVRAFFPSCFCFCVGTPEGVFLGASPELLVRRSGASVSTVALAGSTRRSSDPAVDDHLGERLRRSAKDRQEHGIVARRIVRALRPRSVWVEAGSEPMLVKVANIQHLATPIHAQLAEPRSAIELAGMLHPTPAVGGEPWPAAAALIGDLEAMDRGWYAGPIGWMDATEDGEFCVGVRSALLRDREAHLYAGNGIVAASDPAAELAETEIKLEALLPLLSG
jgi:menaquinone-specific isochorismate synthase